MNKRIPLSTPTSNGSELDFIKEAFDTNWIAPLGPHVDSFECEVAAVVGVSFGAALSSGTAAIHLALKAAGVKPGDVVLCQDNTFAATCNPIMYEHGKAVFVDSERRSLNICPDALEKAFKKYKNAKAVLAVNLYGTPAEYERICEICERFGVVLIEDAAESLGSTLNGKQTAGFGHISILSFNGNKIITTSGGGMLLSNDKDIIKKVKFWATQARDPARHYEHSELGYNYRMSNVCAGIGRGQLLSLNDRIARKTSIYKEYARAFNSCKYIKMNPVPETCVSNYWLSCIILEDGCPVTPEEILIRLESENIEARPMWKPMHLQPYYKDCDFIKIEPEAVSADIFMRGLCLPSDVKMTEEEQKRVTSIILSYLK